MWAHALLTALLAICHTNGAGKEAEVHAAEEVRAGEYIRGTEEQKGKEHGDEEQSRLAGFEPSTHVQVGPGWHLARTTLKAVRNSPNLLAKGATWFSKCFQGHCTNVRRVRRVRHSTRSPGTPQAPASRNSWRPLASAMAPRPAVVTFPLHHTTITQPAHLPPNRMYL